MLSKIFSQYEITTQYISTCFELLVSNCCKWNRENKVWVCYLFVIILLSFTYELFNFTLSIDEENWALVTEAGNSLWIAEGRWGMYFLSYLFPPNPIVPFTPLFICLIFSGISFTLVVRIFSEKRTVADFLAAPFFIACPTLYYIYQFNSLVHGIGIGLFLSAFSLFIFVNTKGWTKGLAIPLAAFSFGIYQSLVPWMVILFCFHLIGLFLSSKEIKTGNLFLVCISFGAMLIASLVVYFLINKALSVFLKIPSSQYISHFVNFNFSTDYLINILIRIKNEMAQYYLGGERIYGNSVLSLKYLFEITLIIILMVGFRKLKGINLVSYFLVIIFILLFPFTLHLINNGIMPVRTMLAVPLVFSGLVYFSFSVRYIVVRILIVLLVIICFFRFTTINNQFSFSDYFSWEADKVLTIRLLSVLDQLGITSEKIEGTMPLVLIGSSNYIGTPNIIHRDTIGVSYYSWGQINRILAFMKTFGVSSFRPASAEQQRFIWSRSQSMPIWPQKGSVAIIDGIATVKLGDHSSFQLETMGNMDNLYIYPSKTKQKSIFWKYANSMSVWPAKESFKTIDGTTIIKLGEFSDYELSEICKKNRQKNNLCRVEGTSVDASIRLLPEKFSINQKKSSELIYQLVPSENNYTLSGAQIVNNNISRNLTIMPLGNDPSIIIPNIELQKDSTAVMNISIDSINNDSMQIFYQYPDDKNFTEKQMVSFFLTKGENSLSILLPGVLCQRPIRIDPSSKSERIIINEISIYKF